MCAKDTQMQNMPEAYGRAEYRVQWCTAEYSPLNGITTQTVLYCILKYAIVHNNTVKDTAQNLPYKLVQNGVTLDLLGVILYSAGELQQLYLQGQHQMALVLLP